jgi:hypothetical protein
MAFGGPSHRTKRLMRLERHAREKTFVLSEAQIQVDLDTFMASYNFQRTHQGY